MLTDHEYLAVSGQVLHKTLNKKNKAVLVEKLQLLYTLNKIN